MAISSDAVAGLVGVVTGSVITGGFQYATARRSERREARAARRLVHAELGTYYFATGFASNPGQELPEIVKAQMEDRSVWTAYSGRLARDLPDDAWLRVEAVYSRMQVFASGARHSGRVPSDRASKVQEQVGRAMEDLAPLPRRRLLDFIRSFTRRPEND